MIPRVKLGDEATSFVGPGAGRKPLVRPAEKPRHEDRRSENQHMHWSVQDSGTGTTKSSTILKGGVMMSSAKSTGQRQQVE